MQRWKPHVTVAAVVEDHGRFLMVREHTTEGIRFNQPAGHLEHGETLLAAVVRETLEETGWLVEPTGLLGIYQAESSHEDITYLRFTFICRAIHHDTERALDEGIIEALWLDHEQIIALRAQHRGPSVERCLNDYLAAHCYPLDMIHTI